MPTVDVSGLNEKEKDVKTRLRKEIQEYFAATLHIKKSSTKVVFIEDDTISDQEHVMVRLYSKSFTDMPQGLREQICDDIVTILESAAHPFNEAFIVPVMAMRGRHLKQD